MIKPIFNHFRELARAEYLESLKEAEHAEDLDIIDIDDQDEECPVCDSKEEIQEFLRNETITREIEFIVIHVSGTKLSATVSAILRYCRNKLGWKNPPYHIIINAKGGVTFCAPLDSITNGVKGWNSKILNVSIIGGTNDQGEIEDTRTPEQIEILDFMLPLLKEKAQKGFIKGHRDFPNVKKACPCFDAMIEYAYLNK